MYTRKLQYSFWRFTDVSGWSCNTVQSIEKKMINDNGHKYIEAMALCSKLANKIDSHGEPTCDPWDIIEAQAKVMKLYNAFLKNWNEGRVEALNSKYN